MIVMRMYNNEIYYCLLIIWFFIYIFEKSILRPLDNIFGHVYMYVQCGEYT